MIKASRCDPLPQIGDHFWALLDGVANLLAVLVGYVPATNGARLR